MNIKKQLIDFCVEWKKRRDIQNELKNLVIQMSNKIQANIDQDVIDMIIHGAALEYLKDDGDIPEWALEHIIREL